MLATRFICAGKSRHRDHGGEIRASDVGGMTLTTTQLKRAIDMTDDELAAIAGRAKLTVV